MTQLTQFVGCDVINKNTTDLAVRCSTGSVELCHYKRAFREQVWCVYGHHEQASAGCINFTAGSYSRWGRHGEEICVTDTVGGDHAAEATDEQTNRQTDKQSNAAVTV